MTNYQIVTASTEHLLPIATSMRDIDKREVWAMNRQSPYEALASSLEDSQRAWTALVDGAPAMMWGVALAGCPSSNMGTPWLLSTTVLEQPAIVAPFLRLSRSYVEKLQQGFSLLSNYVHAENHISKNWLQWCGFTVESKPELFNTEKFHLFWKEA